MNREIKFRAWDDQTGGFTYAGWGSKTFALFTKRTNCPRYKITQFTGRKDKNGVEIYGEDIIKGMHDYGPGGFHPLTALIQFDLQSGGYRWNYWALDTIEVIGNRFENEELMK